MAGFLTSFVLLHLGVSRMWLRYPIAILVAYCVFLLLLDLWLWLQRRSLSGDSYPSFLDFLPSDTPSGGGSAHFGGGGDFGGGGAGGNWGQSLSSSATPSSGSAAPNGIGFDLDLDLDSGCLIVIAVVALVGGLGASFYVIYIAPALLAEILVDGALMAGLYKRVKHIEPGNWLRSAIRRTLLPAILVAVFFTVAGYALQKAIPTAQSIGDVWSHFMRVDQ
jgi:hypothetical protein